MKQHDSEADEGFVPTQLEIKAESKQKSNCDDKYERPVDLQARFILGDGVLRKQPMEMLTRFRKYLEPTQKSSKNKQKQPRQIKSKKKQKKQTNPYKLREQGKKSNKMKSKIEKQSKFLSDNENEDNQSSAEDKTPHQNMDSEQYENTDHPYQKYINNENYHLVYSRYKDRIQTITSNSDDFSSNEINLSKVLTEYDSDHYSILKKFQYPHGLCPKYHHTEHENNRESQAQKTRKKPNKTNLTIHHCESYYSGHHSKTKGQCHEHHIQNNNIHFSLQPSQKNEQLQFDSRFECGNLLYAFKNKKNQHSYALFLQNDTNTYGYNQWFCFALKNIKNKISYQFTIVNLRKKYSLHKEGMKISVFSLIDANKNNGNGWTKMGNNIKYQKSNIIQNNNTKLKFYSLSFSLEFRHEGDYVCVALNTPYSYSRLTHHMRICSEIVNKKNKGNTLNLKNSTHQKKEYIWENGIAGYSISNNGAPYITISPKQPPSKDPKQQLSPTAKKQKTQQAKKKAIIILARQHPGQTLSSFMMEQILYLLAENSNESVRWLLENYIFKIFPMINIDGVIYGNFRCDLAGFDLNRNWHNPNKTLHPQIFAIKAQIEKIEHQLGIECVLDLHGHSKQFNTFSYSCRNDPITSRVLSLIISELNSMFHFPYCSFGLSKYKQTTARGVIYSMTGNENILTIQNSFYGAKLDDKIMGYDPQIMGEISKSILEGIYRYLSKNQLRERCQQKIRNNLDEYITMEKNNQQMNRYVSGSESDPFIDEIAIRDKIKKILPKSFLTMKEQLEKQEKYRRKKHFRSKKKNNSKKLVKRKNQHEKSGNQNAYIKKKTIATFEKEKQKQKEKAKNEQNQKEQQPSQIKDLPYIYIQRQAMAREYKKSKQQNKKPILNISHNYYSQYNPKDKTSLQSDQQSKHQNTSRQKNQYIRIVSDFSLPFYVREKATLVPLKLKNDSLAIVQQSNTKNLVPTAKGNISKIAITNSFVNSNELPLLCILSQQKKKNSLQKNIMEQSHQKNIQSIPCKSKSYIQNEKKQHIKKSTKLKTNNYTYYPQIKPETEKMKYKNQQAETHNNANLISKMWRENFARYGKDINTFFSG